MDRTTRMFIACLALIGLFMLAVSRYAHADGPGGPPPGVGPGGPGPVPRAQLVLRHDSLLLIGADGRERFAIADDGTIELSLGATIDFSPAMAARAAGEPAAYVRVRMGGRLFVLQLLTDPDAVEGPGGGR